MGNALFYGITRGQLQLQRVQNSAVGFVTTIDSRHHIIQADPSAAALVACGAAHPLQVASAGLPRPEWSGPSPHSFAELLQEYVPCRELRSVSRSLLVVPPSRMTWGDRSFRGAAPHLWNSLPASVRQAPSLLAFKNHLKNAVFTLLQTGDFNYLFYFYSVQHHEHTVKWRC